VPRTCGWIDFVVKAHRLCVYETTLEKVVSRVAADAFPWSAPKDMSSSLLEELATTIYERRAVDFVLRIYTILYE